MMATNSQRDLGKLEATVAAMKDDFERRQDDADKWRERIEHRIEVHASTVERQIAVHADKSDKKFGEIAADLGVIKEAMSQARGGWKMMTLLLTIAAGVGGFVSFLLKLMTGLVK